MSWSSRRRTFYLLGVLIFFGLVIGIPLFFYLHEPPTCTDGVKNGTEQDVDCGGNCPIVCSFSAAEPIVHWSRFFEVVPGVYSVVARVENPNVKLEAVNVPYTFKLRDSDNVLVYEKKGVTTIAANSILPIFETGLRTGARLPSRIEFSLGEPVWTYGVADPHDISIESQRIENEASRPLITATIRNNSTNPVPSFAVVALVYDAEENVLNVSRTLIDGIPSLGEVMPVFTWPQPFSAPVVQIEIVPIFTTDDL